MSEQKPTGATADPLLRVSSNVELGLDPELSALAVLERLQKPHLVLSWKMADELFSDAAKVLARLEHEASFYRRRVQALEQWQSRMRDPERTVVCDILANGHTLPPNVAGDRYKTSEDSKARDKKGLA